MCSALRKVSLTKLHLVKKLQIHQLKKKWLKFSRPRLENGANGPSRSQRSSPRELNGATTTCRTTTPMALKNGCMLALSASANPSKPLDSLLARLRRLSSRSSTTPTGHGLMAAFLPSLTSSLAAKLFLSVISLSMSRKKSWVNHPSK